MPASSPIRKAVFPVAGLGTRFLPATKSVPKEMLPVVDRPLIQYAVEEAVAAGIDTLVFVTRGDKSAILEYFAPDTALEASLSGTSKKALLAAVKAILPAGIRLVSVIQEQPLGLGHAVLCARDAIGDDPAFAVLLPDDMVRNQGPGALEQLLAVHARTGASVVGVEAIDPGLTDRYGIARVVHESGELQRIVQLVEKPTPAAAPSNLGVVGRYLLDSRIFGHLARLGAGSGGEIQLTDAIAAMLAEAPVHACQLQGVRYDCGNRLGMLKANIDYALAEPELRQALLDHLESVLER